MLAPGSCQARQLTSRPGAYAPWVASATAAGPGHQAVLVPLLAMPETLMMKHSLRHSGITYRLAMASGVAAGRGAARTLAMALALVMGAGTGACGGGPSGVDASGIRADASTRDAGTPDSATGACMGQPDGTACGAGGVCRAGTCI